MAILNRDHHDEPYNGARSTGKRLLYVLIAAVVVVGAVILVWPDGLLVDIETVHRGPMEVVVAEDGRTRVRDRFVLQAPVSATLLRVPLEAGDMVGIGQALIELMPAAAPMSDPRTQAQALARVTAASAALESARANADQAAAALAIAQQATTRQRVLLDNSGGTPAGLERAELEERIRRQALKSAEFGVQVAEQDLLMARTATRPSSEDGRRTVVSSPIDGQVLRVLNEGGGLVQAGAPILELGDPTALEVVIDVLTSDATRIRVGCDVVLERWGGAPLRGTVRRVEPSAFTRLSALGVEEQRVNVIVDLEDSDPLRPLGDGYRVEARIVVWSTPEALQVPASAVFSQGETWAVFVNSRGTAELREVELGEWGNQFVEVANGLAEGDQVVAYPSDAVVDGIRIRGGK